MAPASRKYSARMPSSANTFEVKTTNVSVVTARIAGIESTAKITSVVSIMIRASSSGVASTRPPSRTRNRWPCSRSEAGRIRRRPRRTMVRCGWGWLPPRSILIAA